MSNDINEHLNQNPSACRERPRHYGKKCQQHLTRVRLSHVLSSDALERDTQRDDVRINDLIRISFDAPRLEALDTKLRRGLNEVHLAALKTDFELFLNRVLTVVWTVHFAQLTGERILKRTVALRELAEAIASGTSGRDFVAQTVVPK
jgi:hypothetical protein